MAGDRLNILCYNRFINWNICGGTSPPCPPTCHTLAPASDQSQLQHLYDIIIHQLHQLSNQWTRNKARCCRSKDIKCWHYRYRHCTIHAAAEQQKIWIDSGVLLKSDQALIIRVEVGRTRVQGPFTVLASTFLQLWISRDPSEVKQTSEVAVHIYYCAMQKLTESYLKWTLITSAESYQVPFALSGSFFQWPGPYKDLFGILSPYWVLIFTVLASFTQRMSIQSAWVQQSWSVWWVMTCTVLIHV